MRQPIKKNTPIVKDNTKKPKKKKVFKRKTFVKSSIASELDGSGLETYFKLNILDKLGLNYSQQFEAKSIGRFYDFFLPELNIIIECDGDYYHKNPTIYESAINKMQKRNVRVDKLKDDWALMNGYVLLRFWESDIYNKTSEIVEFLTYRIGTQTEVMALEESKKNGSFFKKK